MYWIFKQDGYDEAFFKALPDIKSKQTIVIPSQKRNFGGDVGDNLVILTVDKGVWLFAVCGEITEISRGEPDIDEKAETTILFQIEKRLEEPNLLDDFAYTLLRIKDFERPEKHFRRVNKITKEEYSAIVSGYIFIARTVFGKFVNAMHRAHRIAFVKYLIDENPNLFFSDRNYGEAYNLLNTYMQGHIFQHVEYLQRTYQMLQELAENDAGTIGFSDTADGKVDLISEHAAIIMQGNQSNILLQKDYIDETLSGYLIGQSSEEKGFNKLFKNLPLPILI